MSGFTISDFGFQICARVSLADWRAHFEFDRVQKMGAGCCCAWAGNACGKSEVRSQKSEI
jgi:hypothetical protein